MKALSKAGDGAPCCLRLPQLALHPMSGSAGVIENPTMRTLLGRVLEVGFQTDADAIQGVERLASRPATDKEHPDATKMVANYCDRGSNPLAPAFGLCHTKGWKRTVAANLAMAIVQECGLETELPDAVKASFATVHSLIRPVKDLWDAVERARLITTASTMTRRPVNCFNHLHQLRLLAIQGRSGADDFTKEWNQKQVQAAFKIGPTEAAAASNLAFETTPYMVSKLTKLAEEFGMHNRYGPLHHSALASRLLCTGGVVGGLGVTWTTALTNTDESVNFLADRINCAWRRTPKAFRKPLTVEAWPRITISNIFG